MLRGFIYIIIPQSLVEMGRVVEDNELLLNLFNFRILGVLLYCKRTPFHAWYYWEILFPTRIVITFKKKKEPV